MEPVRKLQQPAKKLQQLKITSFSFVNEKNLQRLIKLTIYSIIFWKWQKKKIIELIQIR